MDKRFAIIEIGSNNTKTHVYENDKVLVDTTITIEFKKNYTKEEKIVEEDLKKLYKVIEQVKNYTDNIHVYGCSIFRKLSEEELNTINKDLKDKFNLEVEVVSQEKEAEYTALGCYNDINYNDNICIFIGGGGSIELLLVKNKKIIDKKHYNFGVVDITKEFPSLKDDIPTCTFDEVYNYISTLITDINKTANILILAGVDHLYWYNNAEYKLEKNTLYESSN